jgi:hypothetical protein
MTTTQFNYTPRGVAIDLLNDINFNENDIVLEPFRGGGAFYNNFPENVMKNWSEITDGRDFFTYEFPCRFTKIITNPPYKDIVTGKNIMIKCLEKMFEICDDEVWSLFNQSAFGSMTPKRLSGWRDKGFEIHHIRIIQVKKWYGRYYWVCFKKKNNGIIKFSYNP